MNIRILSTTLALLVAATAFADGPIRRTVVIRDGKVISGDRTVDLEGLTGKRAFLGVSLIDISPDLREHYGATKQAGVLVGSVEDGSPADKAGIRVGDVIVSVDGKNVQWSGDIRAALHGKKDGDTVRIESLRNRSRQTAVATVVERDLPRMVAGDFLPRDFSAPQWRARLENMQDCGDLQSRIRDLEARLKDLEKKLQK